ncbi:MAG: rhomboid family intramembrane serine protease [Thermodesulfobacteriota bacterium]|nr:rhomboid family intramembrane serine protease [Thermodesulfobacteriota bacterium]
MNEYSKNRPEPQDLCDYSVSVEKYLHRSVPKARAEIWSLVLTARDVPHKILYSVNGCRIAVPPDHENRAATELEKYENENRAWPLKFEATSWYPNAQSTFLTLLILTAVFSICFSENWRGQLIAIGSGDVDSILHDGQWWRLVTALTLHADPPHLLGNMMMGGLLMIWLCSLLGIGLGWGITLLSGILGNLINTLVHGEAHRSIGFSTAIFGTLGVIIALQTLSARRFSLRDCAIPLGAGFALLGFLGAHGEHTDLGAHLFGFLSGLILGLLAGQFLKASGLPSLKTDHIIGIITCFVPILAWFIAFQY